MRRLIISIALTWASCSAVADIPRFFSESFDSKSRAHRNQAVGEVISTVSRLSSLVQTPRPSEKEWVAAERDAISKLKTDVTSTRTIQLLRAPEYQQVKLYEHLVDLENALLCIKNENVRTQREMHCWAVASYLLSDRFALLGALEVLVEAKRLPAEISGLGNTAEGSVFQFFAWSRIIQEKIVLPYLRGEIK